METKNYFAQTAAGKVLPGASVTLYQAGTSVLATGLTDADGAPKTNPFLTDLNGLIQFAAPDGHYDLRVTSGVYDYRIRIQCLDLTAARAAAEQARSDAEGYRNEAQALTRGTAITTATTNHTLGADDAGKYLRLNAVAPATLTVPPQADVSWQLGSEVHVRIAPGSNPYTLTPGTGVTLNAPSGGSLTMSENMTVTLKVVAENEWDVIGQTEAA